MHPIAFEIGEFALHWYGVLIAIGAILAIFIANKWGDAEGLPKGLFGDLGFWSIILGIAGARGWYVLQHLDKFDSVGAMLNVRSGGLVSYGGLLGVLAAFGIVVIRKKQPLLKVLDILAPLIPLGHVFGRLGCFMAGCCHGHATDVAWAVTFTDPLASMDPTMLGQPLHPTQLYAAGYLAALAGALIWYRGRKRFDGELILIYLTAYPILRSINEIYRGDSVRGYLIEGWVTTAQATSFVIALVALAGWWWMGKVNRDRAERKAAAAAKAAAKESAGESTEEPAESTPEA
ncbi:MAG: prolipoprotein diacylglyceryl transferase [Myxococcota bacterium]|nr:prolipoprotein diacylglyceryl transferase [Myxococcota bacterium]